MAVHLKHLLFPVYAATLIAPLFVWRDWWSRDTYAAVATVTQIVGLMVMLAAAWTFRGRIKVRINAASISAAAFFLWCSTTTFWSINILDTLSGVATFLIFAVAVVLFWRLPVHQRSHILFLVAITIFAGLLALYLYHPFNDRTLGGITPNLLAHTAILAVFCLYIARRYRAVGVLLAITVIFMTEARTALISIIIFLISFHGFLPLFWRLKVRWLGLSLLTVVTLIVAVLGPIVIPFVTDTVTKVTGVTVASRIDHDLTGRTAVWKTGLSYFYERPLSGYGFKTRTSSDLYAGESYSAHSGAINVALDVGLIGAILFFSWYLASLYRCFDVSHRYDRRSVAVCASFLVANVPLLVAEPNYLSFGHPSSFALLLSMFCPIALRQRRLRHAPDRASTPDHLSHLAKGVAANPSQRLANDLRQSRLDLQEFT